MKKQLLIFFFLLAPAIIFSQCNYSFVLADSFGDGWNGNTMNVRQNGNVVATIGASFTTGAGPIPVSVSLQDNTPFELFWNTGGSYPSEVKISIVNPLGQTIYTKYPGTGSQNSVLYTGTVMCNQPSCISPNNVSTSNITQTSATLSWDNNTGASEWEVLALPALNPAPSASDSGTRVTANLYTLTGLTCFTNYKVYVRTVCDSSTFTSWNSSFPFSTLNCDLPPSAMCSGANSLCGAFGSVFTNTTGVPNQGAMGCLGTTNNPAWFYFSVAAPGNINLEITQNTIFDRNGNPTGNGLDADYIIYGPYSEPATPCSGQLTPDKIVSCSYSSAAIERPSFTTTQTGQYYYLMVTNYSNSAGYIKIAELPTTTASLECAGFRLNAFLDSNSNGVKDVGEQSFPHGQFSYERNNDSSLHNVLSSTGILNIYDDNASNTYDFGFQMNSDYAAYYAAPSASYNDVTIAAAGLTVYNFAVVSSNTYKDLAVSIVPSESPRPGFTYKNKIIYTNNGNQTIANGTLSFTKGNVLSITNISQTGTVSNATGFTYDFTNLLPFETRIIEVTLQVPTIPTVQLGDIVNNSVSGTLLSGGDLIAENNNFNLTQGIVGSYDPNDIMESHGDEIVHASFTSDNYLYYTIRFENTGTAAALNVRVNDLLNVKLDETTLKMVHASHNYVMDRVGSTINWEFKNIGLAATSQNPTLSKGYIIYKIKPKPGYAIGDIIPNTGAIYFDFNPAIITNTFNTEFVSQLGVTEFENNSFIFYPNPVKEKITISAKDSQDGISNVILYDISGKIVVSKSFSSTSTSETIDLSQVSNGMYLIEVTTKSNLKTIKKIIVE